MKFNSRRRTYHTVMSDHAINLRRIHERGYGILHGHHLRREGFVTRSPLLRFSESNLETAWYLNSTHHMPMFSRPMLTQESLEQAYRALKGLRPEYMVWDEGVPPPDVQVEITRKKNPDGTISVFTNGKLHSIEHSYFYGLGIN